MVTYARRCPGPGPGGIVGANVVEPRDDSHDAAEIPEQGDSRLELRALKCREPVLAVHFDVHELDERCAAHARKPAPRPDRDLAVTQLDHPAAHANDLP